MIPRIWTPRGAALSTLLFRAGERNVTRMKQAESHIWDLRQYASPGSECLIKSSPFFHMYLIALVKPSLFEGSSTIKTQYCFSINYITGNHITQTIQLIMQILTCNTSHTGKKKKWLFTVEITEASQELQVEFNNNGQAVSTNNIGNVIKLVASNQSFKNEIIIYISIY